MGMHLCRERWASGSHSAAGIMEPTGMGCSRCRAKMCSESDQAGDGSEDS